ncbi:zf-CGNR multi-domain protein [Ktedonosporobacter rubrisoli]|uniref:Zf-CGNR multi-domain protein n=1 Tax=Ktedonosporobacter rubrisoli TaxID=2509675 RepID=A0A4P6JY37_KTERU|nr:CGNR zinc finger domain-containing protein [Ktedonosporobacter rubrisoli]QBD80330.1 zf-CGNR multi-domain protein [Ktedonosporobacter rubrisoli]
MDFTHYTSRSVSLAVDLINTLHPVSGRDTLLSEEDLRKFMEEHEVIYELSPEEADKKPHYRVAKGMYRTALHSWELSNDDVLRVRALRSSLRTVFELASVDEQAAAALLNEELRASGATPRISWHHGPFHLHFESAEEGCAHWLTSTTAMGLAVVLCEFGADRFGICASPSCQAAFIDASKNMRKRYCSEACAHRESVAAFRARRRRNAKSTLEVLTALESNE